MAAELETDDNWDERQRATMPFKVTAATGWLLTTCLFAYGVTHGMSLAAAVMVYVFACLCLGVLAHQCISPDTLRSQYTEEALSTASEMLDIIKVGLTPESAEAVCRCLLKETRAMAIAITDDECVLACVGELAADFPPGSPIHTPATHYVLDHGISQSFTHAVDVPSERTPHRAIPAGIIAPLKVRDKAIGTRKFYYRPSRQVNRTQYALAAGFAELLSTQLAIHELELQEELTARAEVRALQAQINPHFLFNTLNTIAALTRTEPLRARELLREFAQFYRATLDNSGSLIPVTREVVQTMRYLKFEKARFGEDRILVHVDIAEDAEEVLVPAFTIQPLVENAVRHAMPDEGPLHIDITVRSDDDGMVVLEVVDDGVGMDEETAARLFDATLRTPDASAPQGGGAGVAMRNISERIERFFGPRSQAIVSSKPGEGTTISLRLDPQNSILAERRVE